MSGHSLMLVIALLALLIWLYLIGFHGGFPGGFWRSAQKLAPLASDCAPTPDEWPKVVAIVPARNEADVIAETLTSLLEQDYPGALCVILVDDHSDDGSATVAREAALRSRYPQRFSAVQAAALPQGWTGKLWALQQGVQHSTGDAGSDSEFVWFSDADIKQPPQALRQLVAKAQSEACDLVSLMVVLRCEQIWERLLIPPFIYFFQKLYPFAWVNDVHKKMAAAAGGCILLRRTALQRIGGLAAIRDALIDDCALAAAVKASAAHERNRIWLGLAREAHSIRPYAGLRDIWAMVARSAYTQLRHSPLLLVATLFAMALTYFAPPLLLLSYPWHQQLPVAAAAGLAWLLMSLSLLPTLKLYAQPLWLAPLLPLAAALYSAMTFDSAWRHWRGVGGYWKGRVHAG